MNHELIQQKLMALYDSPLTEKERKLLESHLAECPACRKAIAEWKVMAKGLFSSHTFSEASEDIFVNKVMARVRSAVPETNWNPWNLILRWMLPLVGSAAIASWAFFSILPSDIYSGFNVESAFTSSSSLNNTNGITSASYSTSDEFNP